MLGSIPSVAFGPRAMAPPPDDANPCSQPYRRTDDNWLSVNLLGEIPSVVRAPVHPPVGVMAKMVDAAEAERHFRFQHLFFEFLYIRYGT